MTAKSQMTRYRLVMHSIVFQTL